MGKKMNFYNEKSLFISYSGVMILSTMHYYVFPVTVMVLCTVTISFETLHISVNESMDLVGEGISELSSSYRTRLVY